MAYTYGQVALLTTSANMTYGHDFTITVTLNGETAQYPVHLA